MSARTRITRRRLLTLALTGAAASAVAAACGDDGGTATDTPAASPTRSPTRRPTRSPARTPSPEPTPEPTPAPTPTPSVSLEEKVGQMLMVGFNGTAVSAQDRIAREIRDQHLGGVALFGRNIQSPAQIAQLDADLKSFSQRPLLISTDQEGGQVARLRPSNGFPDTPSHASLGERNDLNFAHEQALAMAMSLRDAGINVNLAPVCDVNVNPDNPIIARFDRSFSSDPDVVAAHALEFVRAHHEAGVMTTLKHFPGHGSSTADSHAGFVDVTDTWSDAELAPFARIIDAGEADLVMMAAIFNANLDSTYPAVLSHATTTGLLRNELGFDGVIISDSMQLGAITQNYSFEDAIVLSVQAGVDILAYANNNAGDEVVFANARDVLLAAVRNGTISEGRIDESFQRIQALKSRAVV